MVTRSSLLSLEPSFGVVGISDLTDSGLASESALLGALDKSSPGGLIPVLSPILCLGVSGSALSMGYFKALTGRLHGLGSMDVKLCTVPVIH